jgi:hypothetical protein
MPQPPNTGHMDVPEPYKEDYDKELDFSRITEANWFLPDRKNYMPLRIRKDEWAEGFLAPKLNSSVPLAVRRLFEVARGCMICSWYFYPLATLGFEQMTRVGELAVHERCQSFGNCAAYFKGNLETLAHAGVISPEDKTRWEAVRDLRNDRSHPKTMMLIDPGQAVGALHSFVELINKLFPESTLDKDKAT